MAIQTVNRSPLEPPSQSIGPYKPLWIDLAVWFYIYYMADWNGHPVESVIFTKGRDIHLPACQTQGPPSHLPPVARMLVFLNLTELPPGSPIRNLYFVIWYVARPLTCSGRNGPPMPLCHRTRSSNVVSFQRKEL